MPKTTIADFFNNLIMAMLADKSVHLQEHISHETHRMF